MKILAWISIFLCACSILCGLWMKFGPGDKDVSFHAILILITLAVCLVTIILFLVMGKS